MANLSINALAQHLGAVPPRTRAGNARFVRFRRATPQWREDSKDRRIDFFKRRPGQRAIVLACVERL